jgi:hypothetical protein
MQTINYFALLGQPFENAEIQAIIRDYALQDEMKDIDWVMRDHEGNVLCDENLRALFCDENYACSITLSRKPKHFSPLTVDSITLTVDFTGELPCDLSAKTDYDSVNCGIKISFEKNPYGGFGKDFLVEGAQDSKHVVSLYFDEEKQFKSVTFQTLDQHTALLIEFKQDLSTQKPNINASFSAQNINLPSPVIAWRKRMMGDDVDANGIEAGDQIFTEENLSASQAVLDAFLAEVQTAAAKKSPTQLLAAVKTVVKSLNKLTKNIGNFIETNEREELVPYIENVVKAAGLHIPQGLDITLEWRDW